MAKFSAAEVAKHNSPSSCWVILYGKVYDVTSFIPHHPGGAKSILKLAGKDATDEFDPIHPANTLRDNLSPDACLGDVDPDSLRAAQEQQRQEEQQRQSTTPQTLDDLPPDAVPMDMLLNMDDVEGLAARKLSRRALAYYSSAADDLFSKHLNHDVYRSILLRPRVLVDVARCDLSASPLGLPGIRLPFFVCPAAMGRLAHPAGEAGIAEAAGRAGAVQIISNAASMSPEEITAKAAPDQIFGWQLYVNRDRGASEALLARVNAIPNIRFIVMTLDQPVSGKREADERAKFDLDSLASGTGPSELGQLSSNSSIATQLFSYLDPSLTWETALPWLAAHTRLPIILKGVQTHEDAARAAAAHPVVSAILLSNHGGRAADTAPPAVHTLLEIRKYCPWVFDRVEVWVDGGIRRGSDIVKALALGARFVGTGRNPLYALAAGGVAGVERMFQILSGEMATTMRLLGARNVNELGMHNINARAVEQMIYDGPSGLGNLEDQSKAKL